LAAALLPALALIACTAAAVSFGLEAHAIAWCIPPFVVGGVVASSVSFGIYFAIAGAVFLDAYQVPPYNVEDWQLLAGIPLGLFAALLAAL